MAYGYKVYQDKGYWVLRFQTSGGGSLKTMWRFATKEKAEARAADLNMRPSIVAQTTKGE